MDKFLTVVITSPDEVPHESEKICRLIEAGVDYVHIRKPSWSARDVRNLIEEMPYEYRKKLRLHGHYELLSEMNLGGVHVNSRNPVAPPWAKSVSASCHGIKEIIDNSGLDYVTLSPVFDSISKQGYKAAFDPDGDYELPQGGRVVALGGVTPERFNKLKAKGFYGAALLGYIWDGDFETSLANLARHISPNK